MLWSPGLLAVADVVGIKELVATRQTVVAKM